MLDATPFDYNYIHGYERDLPKMQQISLVSIPTNPYNFDAAIFGDILGVVPCSDGMVYMIRIPASLFVTEL